MGKVVTRTRMEVAAEELCVLLRHAPKETVAARLGVIRDGKNTAESCTRLPQSRAICVGWIISMWGEAVLVTEPRLFRYSNTSSAQDRKTPNRLLLFLVKTFYWPNRGSSPRAF